MTGTLVIVGVFLLVNLRFDLKYLGTFVLGLVCILLMIATVQYYVPVVPLPAGTPVVLAGHPHHGGHPRHGVLRARFRALRAAAAPGTTRAPGRRVEARSSSVSSRPCPDRKTLENLAYRVNIVGFIFWTFTLIAGAIWAEKAWGRYWGWDTKEVWTFIIWVIYAGYIHARATRGWRGSRSAWLAIIGFSAVMFNFGVVNVFFHGLHAYSGL